MTNHSSGFPLEKLMPKLECLVIVSETEGYTYESGVFHEKHVANIAKLKNLRDLTFARCSLVPTSDWETFFADLAENSGGKVESIRLPCCNGIDDQVCQIFGCED